MPKVSVIIPIYGVERYIERCVRSLFGQMLEDIEFIFIDDCTKDNSIIILRGLIEEYEEKINNYRWRIIQDRMPVNSGLPKVRRRGIELATGDYILHCDSDDWMDFNMISEMWYLAISRNFDIVICDYYEASDVERKYCAGIGPDVSTGVPDMFKSFYSWALWNKLVKRTVYNSNIVYPKANIGEDMALTLQLLHYTSNIGHVKKPLYYYYKNPSSMTRIRTENQIIEYMTQWKENVQIVDNFYKKHPDERFYDSIVFIKYQVKNCLMPLLGNKCYLRLWKDTFCEINFDVYSCPYISLRSKILFLLTYIGLNLFKK